MKKTFRFLCMAALALVGAVMTGCSSEDNILDNQQPENKNNVITLTTTVSLEDGATTRALTAAGVKTFAVGDQIAVKYYSSQWAKAVSEPLTAPDISADGKTATFTVTFVNPSTSSNYVKYIYPASMANAIGEPDYTVLATQNGTLATLSSELDLGMSTLETWTVGEPLPTLTLVNRLAILAITLKDEAGSSEITSDITGMTISEGSNTYTISRSAADGPIYVAINPMNGTNPITVTATDGTKSYTKTLSPKDYLAGNGYNVTWRMPKDAPVGAINGKFTINASGDKVYFAKGNLQAVFASAGSSCTWQFAEHQWDYIGGRTNGGSEEETGNNFINGDGTVSAAGTVDLFGWVGASGSWTDAPAIYGISNAGQSDSSVGCYGTGSPDNLKSDWGNVTITNGTTGYRTLTKDEWLWVFGPQSSPSPGSNCRTSSTVGGTENGRFAKATVNSVPGIILFPDSYTHPDGVTAPAGVNVWGNASHFTTNQYNVTDWGKMEKAGCVFLPAAGSRHRSTNYDVEIRGRYWSSSVRNAGYIYCVAFSDGEVYAEASSERYVACSVRLVHAEE